MISSEVLHEFNVDGDYNRKLISIQNRNSRIDAIPPLKRIKTIDTDAHTMKHLAEEYFLQSHPFSDLVLVVQGISYTHLFIFIIGENTEIIISFR